MNIKQVVQTSDPDGRPELIQLFVRTGAINFRDHAGDYIHLDDRDSTFMVEIDVAKLMGAIGRKAVASKGRSSKVANGAVTVTATFGAPKTPERAS